LKKARARETALRMTNSIASGLIARQFQIDVADISIQPAQNGIKSA
jgi:hypothetical protein